MGTHTLDRGREREREREEYRKEAKPNNNSSGREKERYGGRKRGKAARVFYDSPFPMDKILVGARFPFLSLSP